MMDKKPIFDEKSEDNRRSETLEILVKNKWCRVFAVLCEDSLDLTLNDSLERFSSGLAGFALSDNVEDLANRKRVVHIKKKLNDGLGVSIKGGKENRMPILISKVFRGLIADLTGKIFVGDAILSVNDINLRDANHEEAVQALKNAGENVVLEVRYLPEVVPYFRKAAILSEIGWSLPDEMKHRLLMKDDGTEKLLTNEKECEIIRSVSQYEDSDTDSTAAQNSDSKSIPLVGAFVRRVQMSKSITSPSSDNSKSKSNYDTMDYNNDSIGNDNQDSLSTNFQEVVVIQSPDLTKCCILRFSNDVKCSSWFRAIHKTVINLNQNLIEQLNSQNNRNSNKLDDDAKIVNMGWFLEYKNTSELSLDKTKLIESSNSLSESSNEALFEQYEQQSEWQPVFIIQTARDIHFYDTFPLLFDNDYLSTTKSSWPLIQARTIYFPKSSSYKNVSSENAIPENIPMNKKPPPVDHHHIFDQQLHSTKIHSSKSSSLSSLQELSKVSLASSSSVNSGANRFAIRIGTPIGIQVKVLAAQTCNELGQFLQRLITSTHESVRQLQAISFSCLTSKATTSSSECFLTIHYKNGIKVSETTTGKLIHQIPFCELLAVQDDNDENKTITLTYSNDSKLKLKLLQNTKPFIFILHSFLAARTTELNL